MAQNLREIVQILQHQKSCLDMKLGQVYPVCMADDMEHLNYAFPLTGPPKWEHGQQVSMELTIPQRIFILGEANLSMMMTIIAEVKANPQPSPSTGQSNFFSRAFS